MSMSVSVYLSGSGYPRIIPKHHRLLLLRRDARAGRYSILLNLYLCFFSFSTRICRPKKLTKARISDPVKDIDSVCSF